MMPFLHDDESHHRSRELSAAHYTDLSRSDIAILTEILNHAPKSTKSISTASYEEIVRSQIAKLPSHLISKIPWLSTFCTLHHKIIPLPVTALLKALQHEVDVAAEEVWAPLRREGALILEQKVMLTTMEDLSILWMRPDDFEAKYRRSPMTEQQDRAVSKCAACTLARIGGNRYAMIALGAFFIGRSNPRIWKKSKRILWMEAWIRNSMDDAEGEDAVIEMWQFGSALRKVRKGHGGSDRQYVDEAMEKARAQSRGSERLQTDSERHGSVGWGDELTADRVFDDPGNPFENDTMGEEEAVGLATLGGRFDENTRLPYAASSIYSQGPEDEQPISPGGFSRRRDAVTELVSLYQRSSAPINRDDPRDVGRWM